MNYLNEILQFFQWTCRFNFGNFEKEEFRKFLRMGLIFALIIGVYWTLHPLKDAIFIQLVGSLQIPFAKTISMAALLPLVISYTKLLEKTSREKMLVILPAFYGLSMIGFSALVGWAQAPIEETTQRWLLSLTGTKLIAYTWYLFSESFGSLTVALFWAFAADITKHDSAQRGFPLVVTIGQVGGIILPYSIGGLPHRLGFSTDALSIFCIGLLTLLIIPSFFYFLKATPPELLKTFPGSKAKAHEKKHEPGFLEGIKLLASNHYLLGIFAATFIYEAVVAIFDFNFKLAASAEYSGVALSNYLSLYGSTVNIVSLLCLLLGISNITRFLGIGTALAAMPIFVGCALLAFFRWDSLSFLFVLLVSSKAVNYALNGPALKQLYIPTTSNAKFKAQAWIETFGSRLSKQAGSMLNMSLSPLQSMFGLVTGKTYYFILSGFFCFPLIGVWLIITIFLSKSFQQALQKNKAIC